MVPFFDKLCGLACFELFTEAAAIGAVEQIYNDDDLESITFQVETVREDQYLEDVYGVSSRIENKVWM